MGVPYFETTQQPSRKKQPTLLPAARVRALLLTLFRRCFHIGNHRCSETPPVAQILLPQSAKFGA